LIVSIRSFVHPLRFLSIAVCLVVLLGVGTYLVPKSIPSLHTVNASSRTFSLVGIYPNWNSTPTDPTIIVRRGDAVTISLSTPDIYYSHRFLLDFDGDGLDAADCGTVDVCSGSFSSSSPTSTPTFTAGKAGNFSYYCTFHQVMVGTFEVQPVPDYSLSASPSSLSIIQGTNANSTITVSSTDNFMGAITLSASSSPAGPSMTFQSNPVAVPPSGSGTSKLTISVPPTTPVGSYTVTINGMNGTTTRSATVSVAVTAPPVPDFDISTNPTTLTVSPGSSATASVTLNSLNGLSGTVSLSASVSPLGPQVSISPTMVTLTSGGSATATLTVVTSGSGVYSSPTATGSYTITITATDSSLSHSATIPFTVGSSSPSGSVNLPVGLIVGGVVAAIVVVGTAALLIRRRSK
jgi:hypothetical protein